MADYPDLASRSVKTGYLRSSRSPCRKVRGAARVCPNRSQSGRDPRPLEKAGEQAQKNVEKTQHIIYDIQKTIYLKMLLYLRHTVSDLFRHHEYHRPLSFRQNLLVCPFQLS